MCFVRLDDRFVVGSTFSPCSRILLRNPPPPFYLVLVFSVRYCCGVALPFAGLGALALPLLSLSLVGWAWLGFWPCLAVLLGL